MKKSLLALGVFTALLVQSTDVLGHANLVPNGSIPPRNNIANKDLNYPCGGVFRTVTQQTTQLTAGQTLTVSFMETIDHPGFYQIWFTPNADDSAMVLLKDNIPDVQGGALPHNYSTTVTIPNVNCTNCAIRMVQMMTESNPPVPYYSCANVQIAGGAPAPSPSPSLTPQLPAGVNCGN
jgi:hypothetical protein